MIITKLVCWLLLIVSSHLSWFYVSLGFINCANTLVDNFTCWYHMFCFFTFTGHLPYPLNCFFVFRNELWSDSSCVISFLCVFYFWFLVVIHQLSCKLFGLIHRIPCDLKYLFFVDSSKCRGETRYNGAFKLLSLFIRLSLWFLRWFWIRIVFTWFFKVKFIACRLACIGWIIMLILGVIKTLTSSIGLVISIIVILLIWINVRVRLVITIAIISWLCLSIHSEWILAGLN